MTAENQLLTVPLELDSFGTGLNVVVFGATGGIGGAMVKDLQACPDVSKIFALSRSEMSFDDAKVSGVLADLEEEKSIANAAALIKQTVGQLHLVVVATGVLHDGSSVQPEKSWRGLDPSAMEKVLRLNTIAPAVIAKHFLPLLAADRKSVFAALSARVGSIEDNELGGWYAYRASKAGLNMILKSLSIELARRKPDALCVGLHPGTVDTGLSKPFQSSVPQGKLFSPGLSARYLLNVLDGLTAKDSGRVFAWDGQRIPS